MKLAKSLAMYKRKFKKWKNYKKIKIQQSQQLLILEKRFRHLAINHLNFNNFQIFENQIVKNIHKSCFSHAFSYIKIRHVKLNWIKFKKKQIIFTFQFSLMWVNKNQRLENEIKIAESRTNELKAYAKQLQLEAKQS